MSISVTSTVTAPPATVWSVLGDVRAWPDWLPTVDAVVPTDPSAADGPGASYAVTQPRLGTATWEITRWEPGHGFSWVSRRPGVTTTGDHDAVPDGDGSRVTLAVTWTGPLAFVARLLAGRLTRSYVEQESAALQGQVTH